MSGPKLCLYSCSQIFSLYIQYYIIIRCNYKAKLQVLKTLKSEIMDLKKTTTSYVLIWYILKAKCQWASTIKNRISKNNVDTEKDKKQNYTLSKKARRKVWLENYGRGVCPAVEQHNKSHYVMTVSGLFFFTLSTNSNSFLQKYP